MTALFSVAQIRSIEAAAAASLPAGALMRLAGHAAANAALALIGQVRQGAGATLPALVLAGPGNNGGDALELAANLSQAGIEVQILRLAGAQALSPEAAHALQRAEDSAAGFLDQFPVGGQWSLIVDGLFGIGLARPLDGAARDMVETVNAMAGAVPVLALDVPSGLNADTGAIVGPDGVAIRASHTITFIGDKPGLHTCQGRDHAGEVMVAPLGIDPAMLPAASALLSGPTLFATWLRQRAHSSHKGSFGDVTVVGGAAGMAGAAVLAARAALYGGAGRVFVAALDPALSFDSMHPELMFRDAATHDMGSAAEVLGPGMGSSALAQQLLGQAIAGGHPLLLDADALNLLAASPALQTRLAARQGPCLMTPHPLEAARLLATGSAAVQSDRLGAARTLAGRFHAVVILKGSGSVIAGADGALAINPTGNPGLATAGTGDVLAGLCGSLLAQGWPAWEAALAGAWLHGAAADQLVAQGVGPVGLSASELAPAIRQRFNQLLAG